MFHKSLFVNYVDQKNKNVQLKSQDIFNILSSIKSDNTLTFFLLFRNKLVINRSVTLLLLVFLNKTPSIRTILTNTTTNTIISNFFINSYFSNLLKVKQGVILPIGKVSELVNLVSGTKKLVGSIINNASTINRHLAATAVNNVEFQFLRKNKVFNKGRYSRCRQNYRTGVYLCMYLSVVCIFGLFFWFYKFSFNFSYLWWVFIGFVGSFFLPKIIKFRLYEPTTLVNKFFQLFRWVVLLVKSLFNI